MAPEARVASSRVLRLTATGTIAFGLTPLAIPVASAIGHTARVPDPGLVILGSLGGTFLLIGAVARLLSSGQAGWNAMFVGAIAGGAVHFALVAVSSGEDGLALQLIPVMGSIAGGWGVAVHFGSLGR